MIYFFDTNIISYLLNGNRSVLERWAALARNDADFSIPSIAYYEIKRGLLAKGATTKLARFTDFADRIGITELTRSTLDIASQIYADLSKTGKIIEDDDIFIGASALEHGAILVTNNERHLGRIAGLNVEVWK